MELKGNRDMLDEGALYSPFLRGRPLAECHAPDLIVLGVPFDSAVTDRPGTRFGPEAIRRASRRLPMRVWPCDWNPSERRQIGDAGDCRLEMDRPERMVQAVERAAAQLLEHKAPIIALGGDHLITYPMLRSFARIYGPLALVHFDAHADTCEKEPGHLHHGAVMHFALQENLIDVGHSVQVGIRTHYRNRGFLEISASHAASVGPKATASMIRERVGKVRAYLSFDIDCLDPAFAPGTGAPVVGGMSTGLVLEILLQLVNVDWVGMDIVELSPPFDVSEISALAAASVGAHGAYLLTEHN